MITKNIFSLPVSNPSTVMIIEGFSRIVAPIGPVKSAKTNVNDIIIINYANYKYHYHHSSLFIIIILPGRRGRRLNHSHHIV